MEELSANLTFIILAIFFTIDLLDSRQEPDPNIVWVPNR